MSKKPKVTLRQTPITDSTESDAASARELSIMWSKQPQRRKRELIPTSRDNAPSRPMRTEVRSRLLKAIAQGRVWLDALITDANQTTHGLAKLNGLSERSIRSTINLALLAPDIVEAAIEGQLPRGITATQMTDLPPDWAEQKRTIGLA